MDGTRPYNAGKALQDLWFDDGVVTQSLTGGARCHNNQFERSTIISFICNQHHGVGRPVFMGESDDCTYYIAWHTDLVCEDQVRVHPSLKQICLNGVMLYRWFRKNQSNMASYHFMFQNKLSCSFRKWFKDS